MCFVRDACPVGAVGAGFLKHCLSLPAVPIIDLTEFGGPRGCIGRKGVGVGGGGGGEGGTLEARGVGGNTLLTRS